MRPASAAQWKNAHAHTVTAPPTAYRDVIFVNIIKCGHYTRATITSLDKQYVWFLFDGGYNLTCGYYSSKYGIRIKIEEKTLIFGAGLVV